MFRETNSLHQGAGIALATPHNPSPPTRHELLDQIVTSFKTKNEWEFFATLPRVDDMEISEIRQLPIGDSAFRPVVEILSAAGIPTNDTVGCVVDFFGLTKEQVHDLACECHKARRGYQLSPLFAKLRRED